MNDLIRPIGITATVILLTAMLCCTAPGTRTSEAVQTGGQTRPSDDDHAGIHNVFEVAPGLISGSIPEGDAGFAALQRMGVRTLVSVDGATPDVESAKRFGMRYVHIPVAYHGIDPEQQLHIARAVRDLPAPVYVHCHHGKHRGPGAAASAAVALDWLSPDEGVSFLKRAGTSDAYPGLYACVLELEPASKAELDRASDDFPAVAPVPDYVHAMSQAQDSYDHLKEMRDAGWRAPASHPDLVAIDEAGRLENILRALQDDPEKLIHPDDFGTMLVATWAAAQSFESALDRDSPAAELAVRLQAVGDSCNSCHTRYRNKR